MAVTETSHTGNGTKTSYTFTFPYLKSTDIEVQLNATVTTNWSLANATTIQFTAPSGGATTTQESGGAPKTGEKIKSEENKYVEFNSTIEHTGSSCTNQNRRIVINFNYV